jgi:hypothetical protein
VSNEESSPVESEERARYDGRSWRDSPSMNVTCSVDVLNVDEELDHLQSCVTV